eukprot:7556800-Karenia_brevis.AAC.1
MRCVARCYADETGICPECGTQWCSSRRRCIAHLSEVRKRGRYKQEKRCLERLIQRAARKLSDKHIEELDEMDK